MRGWSENEGKNAFTVAEFFSDGGFRRLVESAAASGNRASESRESDSEIKEAMVDVMRKSARPGCDARRLVAVLCNIRRFEK